MIDLKEYIKQCKDEAVSRKDDQRARYGALVKSLALTGKITAKQKEELSDLMDRLNIDPDAHGRHIEVVAEHHEKVATAALAPKHKAEMSAALAEQNAINAEIELAKGPLLAKFNAATGRHNDAKWAHDQCVSAERRASELFGENPLAFGLPKPKPKVIAPSKSENEIRAADAAGLDRDQIMSIAAMLRGNLDEEAYMNDWQRQMLRRGREMGILDHLPPQPEKRDRAIVYQGN